MRASKKFTPPVENRSLEEPVYVDEVYPDEPVQEDLWARKPTLPEPTPAPTSLSFKEEDEVDEEEELDEDEPEEIVAPPAPTPVVPRPPEKAPLPPRSYRVKIPIPRDHRPPPRPAAQKPLPTELPRPVRRDNHALPAHPRREREERTGTWPVEHDPKRNSVSQPKNSAPVPPHRTPPPKETPPNQRVLPPARPPVARTILPPLPDIPPFPEPEPILPQAPALCQQEALLPPIFSAPPPVTTPAPILPYEETPTPEAPRFQPLVDETQTSPADDLEPEWELTENSRPHSVHDLIERLALPKNSLILGVCEDGLPLVLELSDPSPGALLFLGDEVEGMQKHLQAILSSICLMSDPKQVQVDIITPSPKTFAPQKMYPHVQKTHLPDQDEMYELLGNLFGLVEQRQRKDNSLAGKWLRDFLPLNKGPVRVLVIDQVDVLVEQLAPESLAYLRWLLRRGPAANVWVLASLNTRNAQCLDGKTLKAFGLRISGKIQNPGQASRLTDVPAEKLSSLISGEQACLKLDEEIVEFSILE